MQPHMDERADMNVSSLFYVKMIFKTKWSMERSMIPTI